jgi:hypothetical protein
MAGWILVPCLVQLRDEFNEIAPNRAKGADGSIGDQAHADRTSDHNPDETGAVPIRDADSTNEVHALDITTDLNQPGLTLEMVVQHIIRRCRSGAENRLRYIIFNRRIWAADENWIQQTYAGTNDPHTGHAHFSASYVSAREASTASWHLEDIPVALTSDDKSWLSAQIKAAVAAPLDLDKQGDGTPTSDIGNAVWAQGIPNGLKPGTPRDLAWQVARDLGVALGDLQGQVAELKAEIAKLPKASTTPSAGK